MTALIVIAVGLAMFLAVAYAFHSRDRDVREHPIGRDRGGPVADKPSSTSARDEDVDPSGSLETHGTR